MKHIYLFFSVFLLSAGLTAQSFTQSFTFDSVKATTGSVDPTPVVSASGTRFSSFLAKGVSVNPNASARFSFTGWSTGATNGATLYSSFTGVLDTGRYYQVTVTPQSGYQLELDSITFFMQRSGTGVRTFAVRSSVDQYAINLNATLHMPDTVLTVEAGNVLFLNKDLTNVATQCTIDLSGGTFTSMGNSVTFRFYGFNAEASTGTFSIDAVNFYGMVNLTTGITEQISSDLHIFPVPSADGMFYLHYAANNPAFQPGSKLRVFSMQGQLVYQSPINSATQQEINLQAQANGVYLLVISNGVEKVTKRISIDR
ncbi:MAG TPA: T9SS type A sorting domain-containing protein [Bacteroidia bacterium]|jgi:hypothetical protein|nr:T9SS type A sorting domain-containing protein [Bacteroidia bacterium]